jgi:hypothetical protein
MGIIYPGYSRLFQTGGRVMERARIMDDTELRVIGIESDHSFYARLWHSLPFMLGDRY